jgi:2,3-bisphosphoglycerate-independent phosphoglycerate mutase
MTGVVENPGESASRSKCIFLIIDGMGDLPSPELNGLTPLEAAYTPLFDHLAGNGFYGLVDPIKQGEIPNTHSGTGMLMGLLPEQAGHKASLATSNRSKMVSLN